MYLVVVKTTRYVLVRSSRIGVWGGALPGTVRPLPVVVENRKEVLIPSQYVRVQRQYSYDADFLYARLLRSKICVIKNIRTTGGFSTGKKNKISICSVLHLSIVLLMFFSLFRVVPCGNQ